MVLNFITLTNDIKKVPKWSCNATDPSEYRFGKNTSFISSDAFSKRIMVLGPTEAENGVLPASEPEEVSPGVFVSTLTLPYLRISVAGSDLRPYISEPTTEEERWSEAQVAIVQIDSTAVTYLDSGTNDRRAPMDVDDTAIINTFHAKHWHGCIAVLGLPFKRGMKDAEKDIHMYVDYVVNDDAEYKVFKELQISIGARTATVVDDRAPGKDVRNLRSLYESGKKRCFRIRTLQRLSDIFVYPEGGYDAFVFNNIPADYLRDKDEQKHYPVEVDVDGVVKIDKSSFHCRELMKAIKKERGNRTRSAIFYKCKPSKEFFEANLNYIFVTNEEKDCIDSSVSFFSLICP